MLIKYTQNDIRTEDEVVIETSAGTLKVSDHPFKLDLGAVSFMALDPKRKCLVRECSNRANDGVFKGTVCSPCAEALQGLSYIGRPCLLRILKSLANAPA
jgi:hypothetical protein